ncbi:MAG TPA: hypothetical protein G4O11_13030 [Anaerolineae bacterium]|nr:hypothetical protein [Anaerolineae bacterium]
MPTGFTRSPKFLKGALVAYESQFIAAVPNIIVFQYNPEQLSRSLSHRVEIAEVKDVGKARSETYRTSGPPVETIDITVTIDAADQLAEPQLHPFAVARGIHPVLAALELLMYPPADQFIQLSALAAAGSAQLSSIDVPLVLFVWGPSRVLPVRLTSFSVTEQAFDQQLNPIRGEVRLGMKVMSYVDLKADSIGYGAYMATQTQKEIMARLNIANNVEQIIGMLPI